MEEEGFQALGPDGIVNYLKAVPFCFYPIFLLIVVLLFCAGVMPKLGGMKKAYDRVRLTGQLYDERNWKYNQQTDDDEIELVKPYMISFLFPMIVFILVAGLCFCTASLLGICALVSPIVFPYEISARSAECRGTARPHI